MDDSHRSPRVTADHATLVPDAFLSALEERIRSQLYDLKGLTTAYIFGSAATGDFHPVHSDVDVGLLFETTDHITQYTLQHLSTLARSSDVRLDFAVMSLLEFPPPSLIFRCRLRYESHLLWGQPYSHLIQLPDVASLRRECLFELSSLTRLLRARQIQLYNAAENSATDVLVFCFKTAVIGLRCLAVLVGTSAISKASLMDAEGALARRLSNATQGTLRRLALFYWQDSHFRYNRVFDLDLLHRTLQLVTEVYELAARIRELPADEADARSDATTYSSNFDEWIVPSTHPRNCSVMGRVVPNDRQRIERYLSQGFRHLSGTALLRYPLTTVIDLSELGPEWHGLPADVVLTAFELIQRVLKHNSKIVEWRMPTATLISIYGPSAEALKNEKTKILQKVFSALGLPARRLATQPAARSGSPPAYLPRAIQSLRELSKSYATWVHPQSQAMFPSLFHPASIEANSLWHAVAQLEGIKVFVAHSMVSFFASYIGTTGDTSAHLAEYHLGGDPYFAIRRTPLPDGLLWIGSQPPVDRPLVFLDRSFSGSTLSRIRQLLTHQLA